MSKKVEAVIFDWAGTTVDYGCFAPVQAFIDAFEGQGIEVTLEEVRQPMGMLKRDHIKTMLAMPRIKMIFEEKYGRPSNEEDIDTILDVFTNKLMEKLEEETELKPFVLETVKEIKSRGIKIGSTTGYTNEMLAPVASRAKILGYEPDAAFTPDDVEGKGRPYPDMIFANLSALNVKPENVIKIGDTVSDIEEAKAAGVAAFAVLEGSSVMGLSEKEYEALSQEEQATALADARKIFEDAGADGVLQDIREIVEYL